MHGNLPGSQRMNREQLVGWANKPMASCSHITFSGGPFVVVGIAVVVVTVQFTASG